MLQILWISLVFGITLFNFSASANQKQMDSVSPVGVSQIEYADEKRDNRPMVMLVFYPAMVKSSAQLFKFPFYTGFTIYKDAPIAFEGEKYPLILLSHGRGGNRMHLAWLATSLASHGYIVATLDHYFATSYYSSYEYLAGKLWERPLDVSRQIDYLLNNEKWNKYMDPNAIGVGGFSQGGFTSLWIGGAKVNPKQFLVYQQNRKNDPLIPNFLKQKMPISAAETMQVADTRIKAVFAMAPGSIQGFGMDEAGLKELKIPTYLIVGEKDTVTSPQENAAFAAKYIPNAKLYIIPGQVGHNIFVNECDQEGKDEFPDACVDDSSVNRKEIHALISSEALKFFDFNLKKKKQ